MGQIQNAISGGLTAAFGAAKLAKPMIEEARLRKEAAELEHKRQTEIAAYEEELSKITPTAEQINQYGSVRGAREAIYMDRQPLPNEVTQEYAERAEAERIANEEYAAHMTKADKSTETAVLSKSTARTRVRKRKQGLLLKKAGGKK